MKSAPSGKSMMLSAEWHITSTGSSIHISSVSFKNLLHRRATILTLQSVFLVVELRQRYSFRSSMGTVDLFTPPLSQQKEYLFLLDRSVTKQKPLNGSFNPSPIQKAFKYFLTASILLNSDSVFGMADSNPSRLR